MKSVKCLSIAKILILLAVIALPYKNGYGTPAHEEIPTFSHGQEIVRQPIITAQDETEYWTCPMHPDVMMEEPGNCPVCGMDLTPVMKGPDSETLTPPKDGAEENVESPDKDTSSGNETHDHSAHGTGTPAPQNE